MSNKKIQNKQNSGKAVSRAQKAKRQQNSDGLSASRATPVSSTRRVQVTKPHITPIQNGTRVVHRELLGTIPAVSGFSIPKRFRVNPASAGTFPWLSTVAGSFESYRFRKLIFRYIGRCATSSPGSLLLTPDYDAEDGAPSTEIQLGQFKDTVEDNIYCKDIRLSLKPESLNRLYKAHVTMDDIRWQTSSQDQKTVDAAQVFVGVDADSSYTAGKIWVEYDVELTTPQAPIINPAQGGANIVIPSAGTALAAGTVCRGGTNAITLQQSVTQPLVADAFPLSGSNNSQVVQFLRDWTGIIDVMLNTSTSNSMGAVPILYKNGAALTGSTDPYAQVLNGLFPGGGFYNTTQKYLTSSFTKGDILSIGPLANSGIPYSLAPTNPVVNLVLGGYSLL